MSFQSFVVIELTSIDSGTCKYNHYTSFN